MVKITLKLKRPLQVPTDLSLLTPESLAGRTLREISNTPVREGNRLKTVRDLFNVRVEDATLEDEIRLVGDLTLSRRIGFRMSRGVITVQGSAGLYLGEGMEGGEIRVHGNTGSWTGACMKNGLIEVIGNVEHFLGSSYRGSRKGMRGGKILIHGDAGDEIGCWMNGGLIHVEGSSGQFTGIHMIGGEIVIERACGGRAGAEMTSGTIICLGPVEEILPSFAISDIRDSVRLGQDKLEGPFYMFEGDVNEGGRGRIYALKEANPHLQRYERYVGTWE
ncbi:MAG: formylmethanofuran dehydrogenase subunit C [Candidatus Bathyarchaeia archaeon]